jgi:hypothetical protein
VAKGGHNGENHNHNDVGSIILYWDGVPILIDVGVGIYTRKTFGPERYTLWPMRSSYHNLPTIKGFEERAGGQYRAKVVEYVSSAERAALSLDLTMAYPDEAGVEQWIRTAELNRAEAGEVSIIDQFTLSEAAQDVAWHWMTPYRPERDATGRIWIDPGAKGRLLVLRYDGDLVPEIESITNDDSRLQSVWGTEIYRLTLKLAVPIPSGKKTMQVLTG